MRVRDRVSLGTHISLWRIGPGVVPRLGTLLTLLRLRGGLDLQLQLVLMLLEIVLATLLPVRQRDVVEHIDRHQLRLLHLLLILGFKIGGKIALIPTSLPVLRNVHLCLRSDPRLLLLLLFLLHYFPGFLIQLRFEELLLLDFVLPNLLTDSIILGIPVLLRLDLDLDAVVRVVRVNAFIHNILMHTILNHALTLLVLPHLLLEFLLLGPRYHFLVMLDLFRSLTLMEG